MFQLSTYIQDIESKTPLEFATIQLTDSQGTPLLINGNVIGRKTNEDGYFTMPVTNEDAYIKVSYVGYETLIHPAQDYKDDIIYLTPKNKALSDVVIKGKKIISKAKKIKWWVWALLGLGCLILLSLLAFKRKKN
ncbi:MAG: carboxypeptidase-like regulatory domain-containing protein [Chitinophagaceae bacterium]